ncbi:MAG: hypothetical protein ACOH2V_12875 [Candidatus Saccharimonadaceae bacterium]
MMTNDIGSLNAFFDNYENNDKEQLKYEKEFHEIKEAFNSSFRYLLIKTIRPAMSRLLVKLNAIGLTAQLYNNNNSNYRAYFRESYLITYNEAAGYVTISLVGNSDYQKVFIYTEYSKKNSTQNFEIQYDLEAITPVLLENILSELIRKLTA